MVTILLIQCDPKSTTKIRLYLISQEKGERIERIEMRSTSREEEEEKEEMAWHGMRNEMYQDHRNNV